MKKKNELFPHSRSKKKNILQTIFFYKSLMGNWMLLFHSLFVSVTLWKIQSQGNIQQPRNLTILSCPSIFQSGTPSGHFWRPKESRLEVIFIKLWLKRSAERLLGSKKFWGWLHGRHEGGGWEHVACPTIVLVFWGLHTISDQISRVGDPLLLRVYTLKWWSETLDAWEGQSSHDTQFYHTTHSGRLPKSVVTFRWLHGTGCLCK